jgi:hypothetical protein
MENNMQVPQKLKTELPCSDTTPRHISERMYVLQDDRAICTPMFTAALFTTAKL